MEQFADIILPLPVPKPFTYGLPSDLIKEATIGKRVIVPFGKSKFYTGIILELHSQPPLSYEVKPVECILDTQASVSNNQLQLWDVDGPLLPLFSWPHNESSSALGISSGK